LRNLGNETGVDRTDAELLSAAANGDGDAYAVLFQRHVRAVTSYAVRRCSNSDEVADLVAETFMTALGAAGRYRPELPTALPWLFGIARRVLYRQRRKAAGAARLRLKAGNVYPRYQGSEEDAITSAIDAARRQPDLEAALDRLPKGEREVLELVAYDGLSPSEVAVVLELTPNAARLRLSRARKRMRSWLEDPADADVVSLKAIEAHRAS
jgi:RNA polymerase sigma-70 factor (ECF subfamily)